MWDSSYEPKSLCHHFWAVVWKTNLLVFAPITLVMMLIHEPMLLLLVVGATICAWLLLLGMALLGSALLARRPHQVVTAPKAPGLVSSYLRARKDKLCPLIEVVGAASDEGGGLSHVR